MLNNNLLFFILNVFKTMRIIEQHCIYDGLNLDLTKVRVILLSKTLNSKIKGIIFILFSILNIFRI